MEKKKMRLWKKIMLIILAIILVIILIIARKVLIVTSLQNNVSKYVHSDNYHKTMYGYAQDSYFKSEIFTLGDRKAITITRDSNGNKSVTRIYANGNTSNIYTETQDKKIVSLNTGIQVYEEIQDPLYTENLLERIFASAIASIKSEKCNGKECYLIDNFISGYILSEDGTYIDKETGLDVRTNSIEVINPDTGRIVSGLTDCLYEFNTVTEKDLQEPDISQYIIQENK